MPNDMGVDPESEALRRLTVAIAGKPRETPREILNLWEEADEWDEAAIPTRPWVAPGYLLRGAVTLLAGPPSAMKSSVVLAWAVATALGRPFGDFQATAPGPVIVYNVEDDRDEQRRRLSAVLRQFDATPGDIRQKVYRVGPETIGTLFERDDAGRVRPTTAMDQLGEMIARVKPAAVFVDPLSELHNVEENDNTAMRSIIARLREVAAQQTTSVCVLHHTRKGAAGAAGDPDSARGASSIIGAVRVALTLATMTEEDAKALHVPTEKEHRSRFVRLDRSKSNYAPLSAAVWFEKVAHQLANGEWVVAATPWGAPVVAAHTTDLLHAIVEDIKRGKVKEQGDILSGEAEPWSAKLDSKPRSVRHVLIRHGVNSPFEQDAVLKRLIKDFAVTQEQWRSHRNKPYGLRVGGLPKAAWIDDLSGGDVDDGSPF